MEIEKVMNLAEFNKAYTAYQTRLMREGAMCTILGWTPTQETHLRCRFASDSNLNLDTSTKQQVFGDIEQETCDLNENIYPDPSFDDDFPSISRQLAPDVLLLEDTDSGDLRTAPEQAGSYMEPVNANMGLYGVIPSVQQGCSFSGRGPFEGTPNVFKGSEGEINGCLTTDFAEVPCPSPQPRVADIPDHCIDPRLLEISQVSLDKTRPVPANPSESIAAAASGNTPLVSAAPASTSTPANSATSSPVTRLAGTFSPFPESTSASSGSTPGGLLPTRRPPSKKQKTIRKQGPFKKQRPPLPKTARRSKPLYLIEGVTKELLQHLPSGC